MRKLNLLFKSFLLLCALIAGSTAWAETGTLVSALNEITDGDTYYIAALNDSKYYTVPNTTIDGQTFTCAEGSLSGTILTPASGAGEFVFTAVNGVENAYYIYNTNLNKYLVATGSKKFGYVDNTSDDYGYWTFTTVSSGGFSGLFSVTHSEKSHYMRAYNNSVRCYDGQSNNGIYLFKKSAANPTKVSTPVISGAKAFLNSTEVTISCSTESASIQYSTDNGTSWKTYTAPFTLNATTTVRAKATKNGLTDSDVSDAVTFTKVTPITVAAALTAINALDDGGTIADQCVSGKVSQVDGYNSTYKSITYWIYDDGSTTSQLKVYGGLGLNGAGFTKMTDLNVGDQVVVYGTLKKYVSNSNTTPEFTQNSQLLSYEATGTPTPIISANNVTIDSEATSGEITYSITNPAGASLTAAVKEGNWISNINVSADKVTFSVTQNTGELRVGYITLSYTGATNKDVKVTQNATYGTATIPFAFDDGKDAIETTNGLTQNSLSSDYSSSPKLKFNDAGDYLILKINSAAQVLNFDIKGNGPSENPWNGTFKVQTSADGVTYTDLKTYNNTVLTDFLRESLQLASTVRYIKWIYTEKTSGNVGIGRIGVNCEAVTVSESGYATFCTSNKINYAGTTGVKVYKVSAIGESSVSLEEITVAPENTPVIIKADNGTYAFNIAANTAAVTGNLLKVSDGNITSDDDNDVYALASKGETPVVGFYKVKANTKVPAGKCYLSVAKAEATARDFLSFIEEGATSINAIENGQSTNEVFDLQGRQIKNPTKGLYIKNGKKVIIK